MGIKKKYIGILILLLCTISNAFGQYFLKLGSGFQIQDIATIIFNFPLLIGLFLYGISAILLTTGLKFGDLSFLYPLISLTYVWVTLLSIFFLPEQVNTKQFFGIGLILFGVFLVARGSK